MQLCANSNVKTQRCICNFIHQIRTMTDWLLQEGVQDSGHLLLKVARLVPNHRALQSPNPALLHSLAILYCNRAPFPLEGVIQIPAQRVQRQSRQCLTASTISQHGPAHSLLFSKENDKRLPKEMNILSSCYCHPLRWFIWHLLLPYLSQFLGWNTSGNKIKSQQWSLKFSQ